MRTTDANRINPTEKARMREEIEAQVREYLRRGGEIDMVSTQTSDDMKMIGDTWHTQVETPVPNP